MTHISTHATHTNSVESNKTLADPLRVSIVEALTHSEMSLSELADLFGVNERLMSYHVRRLMRIGVISEHRVGDHVMYEIDNPAVASACHILYEMWAHEAQCPHSRRTVAL